MTLEALLRGESLGEEGASDLMGKMAAGEVPDALAGALLTALRAKGETADEVRGFARKMRALAIRPDLPDVGPTVDTCGTGGDGSGTINISTGVGLLAAACGAQVVKHGNRSISSRSGSADVLEVLGLSMPDPNPAAMLEKCGFCFLFAPGHHPAMKHIMPVRRALGVRTLFNLLGPLANPAETPYQLVGAFSLEAAELMAHTLAGLDIQRAFVVHGDPGWDEATPVGAFHLFDVREGRVEHRRRDPKADYDLPRCEPEDLAGGDAQFNADRLEAIFDGERGPQRDAIVLGGALVLELLGKAEDPKQGLELARAAIDDGRARGVLDALAS